MEIKDKKMNQILIDLKGQMNMHKCECCQHHAKEAQKFQEFLEQIREEEKPEQKEKTIEEKVEEELEILEEELDEEFPVYIPKTCKENLNSPL